MMAVLAWALPVRGGVGIVVHGVAECQHVAGGGVWDTKWIMSLCPLRLSTMCDHLHLYCDLFPASTVKGA
jgi:hypothetical protein